ncbi:hypothetical protein V8E51_014755 [Hyaloscypha variabilis]
MERKVEEGKRALRELDEKRKAINEQIDRALNTPSVIPTITFRSRAKTLRGEQKDVPRTNGPAVDESKDTPAKSETTSMDAPREVETPAAEEAKDTPVESRAEYEHPPEEPNVAVSDASAESNATENKVVDGKVGDKNAEAPETQYAIEEEHTKSVENPAVAVESEEVNSEGGKIETGLEEQGQTHEEDEAVGTNAVSMPSSSKSNTADTAESAPDIQEPHPEIDNHEAQDGDESDHLKADDVPSHRGAQANEAVPASEDLQAKDGSSEAKETLAGDSLLSVGLASDAKEIQSDAEDTSSKDSSNVPEEPADSKFTDKEPATEAHESDKSPREDDQVPQEEQSSPASDPSEVTVVVEELPTSPEKDLGLPDVSSDQEQSEENPATSDEAVENQPEHRHAEASGNKTNIEEPSTNANQFSHDEQPAHEGEVAEDDPKHESAREIVGEVAEQTTDEPTGQEIEVKSPHEDMPVSNGERFVPAEELHPKVNDSQPGKPQDKDDMKTEESSEHEESEETDTVPEHSETAAPAVAWWEKGGPPATQAQAPASESGWLLRSPPRDKDDISAEPPSSVSQHNGLTGKDIPGSENQEHADTEEHPELEDKEVVGAHTPAITGEHFDETSHLSDIGEENEGPKPTIETEQAAENAHNPINEFPEHQQGTDEVHSPPILNDGIRRMSRGEDRQTHVEEREVDSASETVEHPEVEPENALHGQEQEAGSNEALDHRPEQSILADHPNLEVEVTEQELSDTSSSKVEHTTTQAADEAGNLAPVKEDSSQEAADQEHDILDEYASSSLTPHAESQPSQYEPPLQHPAVPEASDNEAMYDKPATPTQQQSTYDFAPSTPQHLIQEEHQNSLAESPATVLDADDLFEDSDDEEEEQHYIDSREDAHDASQDPTDQSPGQSDGAQREDAEDTADDAPETRAFFASLVNTIRPDISLLRRLANQEPSPAAHHLDDDHSVSEFSQATPGEYYTPGIIDPGEHFPPQATDTGLHIRTNTADTVPAFESYSHSDDASTPTTPSETASSPFVEEPHEQPTIRSSWQDNSALQGSDATEEHHELKPQASPLQGEFDPYNTQTYPNYISPKASSVSLRTDDSRNNSFSYSGGVDPPRFSTQSSISPPPVPAKSPRLLSLNTSQVSQFSEGRPYDSPVSATRSHHESESPEQQSPTQSRIPRRPTDRTIVAARTPVSSPSIPSNSFFQKTRSLFETASQSPSPPAPTRPLSSLFTVRNSPTSSPSPPRRNPNRPSSLLLSSPGQDEITPRSLDKDGKPPSPVFTLPSGSTPTKGKRLSYESRQEESSKHRNSNSFLDGLSKLVGSGGLEDSIHNPNRRLSNKEKEPLLGNAGEMDGY